MAIPVGNGDRPPTSELGAVSSFVGGVGVPNWGWFAGDELEETPELQWPISIKAFHLMRNDSQVEGLYLGSTLPIRRYRWVLNPNGASPEVVEGLSRDLGVPVLGGPDDQPRGRSQRRFRWDKHLADLLLALIYGHYFFEQVGEIGEDGLWHLRKLAPRMPHTISEIKVANDGGLEYIRQNIGWNAPKIPINRMIAYVWNQEGPNFTGRSMLRSCYRPWLIKDRLMRVGPINIERAGGVPVATAGKGANADQMRALQEFASQFKVGEGAGGALPPDAKLALMGGSGDGGAANFIRLCNEEMGRAFLMMFMNLGQTQTGSRALGSEFIDWHSLSQQTIAGWAAEVFNEHMIEDWVDWNYGTDEQAPLLEFDAGDEPEVDAATALEDMVDSGSVEVDEEVEAAIREAARQRRQRTSQPRAGTAERQQRAVSGADASPVALPSRSLRRQPYAHEIQAQVDYQLLESQWMASRDTLVNAIQAGQATQIAELHDLIIDASGDVRALAQISAAPIHADAIEVAMVEMASQGATSALTEARLQGKIIELPDLDPLLPTLRGRAEATDAVLARSLSETAARKAIEITGGALTPAEVAASVQDHLRGLTGSYLEDQLGGAMTQAQNTGRKAVIREGEPETIYASELLDSSTCQRCIARDGTQYQDLAAAERDYPTGGYRDCLGGPRCRGTLVATYATEQAPTLQTPFQVQGSRVAAMAAELVTIPDVPLVSTGIEYPLASGLTTFTEEELAQAVAAQDDPAIQAPRIKLGHDGPLAKLTSDQPAVGKVTNLRLGDNDQTIYGDYTGVPKWLADVLASAYPSRSIEGNFDVVTATGHKWRLVITDVALLGVVWPGVSTLEDIQALYSEAGPDTVKLINAERGEQMTGRKRRVSASVDVEDVRREFYETVAVDDRYWWWIRAQFIDPPILIVDDDEGGLHHIRYSISGDSVEFEDPVAVQVQYVDEDTGKVAAGAAIAASAAAVGEEPASVFASAADSRPDERNRPEEVKAMDGAEIRRTLGLAEDASDEDVRTKLAELRSSDDEDGNDNDDSNDNDNNDAEDGEDGEEGDKEGQPAEEVAASDDGTIKLDKETFERLNAGAQAGLQAQKREGEKDRDETISAAIQAGKFAPARASHWRGLWDNDPEGTKQTIAALSAGLVPVEEQGTGGSGDASADATAGYDPAWLSPQERARVTAAARGEDSDVITHERERK